MRCEKRIVEHVGHSNAVVINPEEQGSRVFVQFVATSDVVVIMRRYFDGEARFERALDEAREFFRQ